MANTNQIKLGVRKTTGDKYRAIATAKRWSLAETADALADKFLESEGITVETIQPARRPRRKSA